MDCLASNDYLLSAGNRRVDCVRLSWWEATAPLPPPQGELDGLIVIVVIDPRIEF